MQQEALFTCCECKKMISPDRVGTTFEKYWDIKKRYVCRDCLKKYYTRCKECGEYYSIAERHDNYPKVLDSLNMCVECLEGITSPCSLCDEYYLEEDLIEIDGELVCEECLKRHRVICSKCGKETLDTVDSEKRWFCSDCIDETHRVADCEKRKQFVKSLFETEKEIYRVDFYKFKNMRTMVLMSRLNSSYGINPVDKNHKPIDVLLIRIRDDWLIISQCKGLYVNLYCKGDRTVTSFKKTYSSYWIDENRSRTTEVIQLSNGSSISFWDSPYRLRAHTASDEDYRKIWRDGVLEYEGNNYGDTSDFYILGTVKFASSGMS